MKKCWLCWGDYGTCRCAAWEARNNVQLSQEAFMRGRPCDWPGCDEMQTPGNRHVHVGQGSDSAAKMHGGMFPGSGEMPVSIKAPTTKKEAEELRYAIMQLPAGFLSRVYVDLNNSGCRMQHGMAEDAARKYEATLP